MEDPIWYKKLSPEMKEAVDQTLHVVCGLFFSALGGSFFSTVVLYAREFWLQWPIERAADTRKDMAFWMAGIGSYEIWRYFQ
jgi:hypothetical protein